jgi:hypothetical protein
MNKEESHQIYRLRRCILTTLYAYFKRFPLATICLEQLGEDCSTDPSELNWNLVYLEKSGWIELSKTYEEPPYVAASVALTAKGVDLTESETGFDTHFPMDE